MKYILVIFIIIFIILLIIYLIRLYNLLIELDNDVKKEYANLDVNLKKRNDLVPNLVEVVKKYMKHEESVLTSLVVARNNIIDSKDENSLTSSDRELSNSLNKLFAVAEGYPDLKATANFLHLQQELSIIEDDISQARIMYNKAVLKFNNRILVFPTKFFAYALGYRQHLFFEVKDEEKEVPKIKF